MTKPLLPAIALTIGLVVMAVPGQALHCNGHVTTIDAGDETLYIDDRSTALGDYDHWWYLEANGVEGLQSGGDTCIPPSPNCGPGDISFTDPCAHAKPDALIL